MVNSTGHGLPQMAKPGNLYLRLLWAVFFVMAVCGGGILVQQAAEQYTKYDVITMTKIKRKTEMIMPTITTCPKKEDRIQDMLLYSYFGPFPHTECKKTNLTLYNHYPINCLQINYGTNKTEWLKAEGEGTEQGYTFIMCIPPSSPVTFTVTNQQQFPSSFR